MVQTYGVARENDHDQAAGDAEDSALLGGAASSSNLKRAVLEADGHASITSCVSNLSNTIIGSGMLTFPLAMATTGVLPGVVTCMFSGGVAAFGLYLLSLCATKAPLRRASFFTVAELTFPKAAIFFDMAIAIKCFGVSISYLIIVKGLMPSVVASLYHDLAGTNPPAWALSGRNWITMFMLVLVPLAFLRKLHSLRHTSYVALFSIGYLVVIVITCYFHPLEGMDEPGEVRLVHITPKFISTFPIQVFAFTCAQNIFPIFNELKSNGQKRMNIVIGSSIGAATLTYEVIAVFGYLTFGDHVSANIIAGYPSTSLFIAIGQLAIVILVLFSYPLQVHPCRSCLDKVFSYGSTPHPPKTIAVTGLDDEENGDDLIDEHLNPGPHEMTAFKHTLLTTAIITCGFAIAYFVDDLQMVLSFVGSTGSTTISFILPGLFYWKLTRNDPDAPRSLSIASIALFIYGCCIFVFWYVPSSSRCILSLLTLA
ncbi:hypothetical protein PLICRDRAFT_112640 [Plicaturopsis crispa FD-325 SS-3]|nr:hypothetical protein PLICRDRAFT_112640 [Plicaturopsis crispa FD-325 SS-3]